MTIKKTTKGCALLGLMLASVASAQDVYRFMGSGNWEDSNWQNQTQGLQPVDPPGPDDIARMNWGNNIVTLSTATEVYQLMTGVDESGTLVVADGGHLTTAHVWSSVGNNSTTGAPVVGTLNVEAGGRVDFGQHLWVGFKSNTTGYVNIYGGYVSVGQMLGLGWGGDNGGVGYVTVYDGGVLDLFQLHGDGVSSMKNGSVLDIQETGQVLLPGNYTNVVNDYIANGSITAWGGIGNVIIDVVADPLDGDFDGDDDADGNDFLVWQLAESPTPLSTEDLVAWQNDFGASSANEITILTAGFSVTAASVPEPSTWILILATAGVLYGFRPRKASQGTGVFFVLARCLLV
ncbi:MAG: PEP-CTERM sorting domain-containing protein [Pirellulales bacterium]|nr:PEP-CTERM sorting domain-containing protein [Pirellulales bacterium]